MRKSFKTSIKVVILLVASILLGTFVGSSMHLTSDVFAEETKHKVYIYAVDNEHPDIFVDSFRVSLYDENGTLLYNSDTHRKDENTEVFELPAGNYNLKILSAPTGYHDSEGNTQRAEGFMYVFDSLETSFTVGDSDVYLELPIFRKTAYTVDFEYQDVTDPSLTVYAFDGPPHIRIYDSNGKVFNATTNTFVEDLKFGDLPAPVNDPSGGTLTDKGDYYSGTEFGETHPGDSGSYYWNGTEWIKYDGGQVTGVQSTHYWQAEILNNMSFDETQGKYIDNYYWRVDFYTQGFQNWQVVALEPGTYEADFSDTLLPYYYIDSEGQAHYTSDGTFYYVSEQKRITFTITDQDVQSYVPVRRIVPHKVDLIYKDVDNPDYQFETPYGVIVNEEGKVVSSADSDNVTYQDDLKLSADNVPVADPVGGALKWNENSYGYDKYIGTRYSSNPGDQPNYYWDGTSWQTDQVYSSTGYWNASIRGWSPTPDEYEWYWDIEWEFNEKSGTVYLESGNYKLLLLNDLRIPTGYQDVEGNYYNGDKNEGNFYYEFVNREIEFTVSDSEMTVEIPIKKTQNYKLTLNPIDLTDPSCTPGSFYVQLFNEQGQVYGSDYKFHDDTKMDRSIIPPVDPVGGRIVKTYNPWNNQEQATGTEYSSDPGLKRSYYWNGISWQTEPIYSSTGCWVASLQTDWKTDELTGKRVPYKWCWEMYYDDQNYYENYQFILPAGTYTLKVTKNPEGNRDLFTENYRFLYEQKETEISVVVTDTDVVADVGFNRIELYKIIPTPKDSEEDTIAYSSVHGYVTNSEGKIVVGNEEYSDLGVAIDAPQIDPDGEPLTEDGDMYVGTASAEPRHFNYNTKYWNGTEWITELSCSKESGCWVAYYSERTISENNHEYYWEVRHNDVLVSRDNYVHLKNGTYTFTPVVEPEYYEDQNGNRTYIHEGDLKPIQPVTFNVENEAKTVDIIIERVPKRKISLTIKDKDASYQINNNGSYRIRNLDTGKFVDQEGNEYELITASKADIPTTDPVGGSLTENGMDGDYGTYRYKGTEYDTEPEMSVSYYYWNGTEWVGSADFLDGCWEAYISSSGHWDSEQGTYITDSWYWNIGWINRVDKAYSGNPIATISKTGNYQVEEATTPTTYINPDGMTISGNNGDVYKKAKPVQFTISDDSPSVIDLEIVYERIPLSQAMPQAGERTALILTMIGCIAMIALAFTLSRPNRTR